MRHNEHMKVLLIGANGNTGFRLARILADGPHNPVAMIRNPDQRPRFDGIGVPTVLGDLEYPVDHAVKGCDAVLFAAGSGGKTGKDKTVLVDQLGAIRSVVAAQVHGCSRYVMLSSINADIESESKIAHYHRAKGYADDFIRRQSDLGWTIVRPGGLHDEPSPGTAEFLSETFGSFQSSRQTLAEVMAACLDEPATEQKIFGLADGETPIREGLRSITE